MQHAKLISVWNLDTPCQFHFINKYEGRHSLSKYLRNIHLSGSSTSSDTCPRPFLWRLMSPWVLLTKFINAEWTCARSFPAPPAPSVLSALDLLGPVVVTVLTGHNAWLLCMFFLLLLFNNVILILLLVIMVLVKEAIQCYSLAS